MRFLVAILLLLVAAPAWAQQSQGMSQAVVVSSCGGGALPSGAVNQLTMDTTGRLCQSGIGSNVCPQATAYLARTVGGNEGGNAVNITALICGLVTDGVITGTLVGAANCGTFLDGLYILAQQNATDASLNLCGTGFSLVNSGGAAFISLVGYHGWSGDGSSTGINPALGTFNFTQNSATLGVWIYSVSASNPGVDISGNSSSNSNVLIANYNSSGSYFARINDPNAASVTTPGTKGLFSGDRSSSASIIPYWNGVAQPTVTSTSVALITSSMMIGYAPSFGATVNTICEAHVGASLGATLELALYTRLRTYMTAIGVP